MILISILIMEIMKFLINKKAARNRGKDYPTAFLLFQLVNYFFKIL